MTKNMKSTSQQKSTKWPKRYKVKKYEVIEVRSDQKANKELSKMLFYKLMWCVMNGIDNYTYIDILITSLKIMIINFTMLWNIYVIISKQLLYVFVHRFWKNKTNESDKWIKGYCKLLNLANNFIIVLCP